MNELVESYSDSIAVAHDRMKEIEVKERELLLVSIIPSRGDRGVGPLSLFRTIGASSCHTNSGSLKILA